MDKSYVVSKSNDRPTKVLFEVPQEDGSVIPESLWAIPLGSDRYQVVNIPFFARSVSWQDTVFAPLNPDGSGRPTYQRVVEKSGNRTLRVSFDGDPIKPDSHSATVLQALLSMGCTSEGGFGGFVSISVPPACNLDAICEFLAESKVGCECLDPSRNPLSPRRRTNQRRR
jgi:hypothetical protein